MKKSIVNGKVLSTNYKYIKNKWIRNIFWISRRNAKYEWLWLLLVWWNSEGRSVEIKIIENREKDEEKV